MTPIEQQQLKGITIKNLVATIISTASIVLSVTGSYFQIRNELHDLKTLQDATTRINEIRLKVLENQVTLLQHDVEKLKNNTQQ